MRRLDIGIAAYRDGTKLAKAVACLKAQSTTDWRLLIVDNPGANLTTRPLIERLCAEDSRITGRFLPENVGYAGAVNEILNWATTENIAYLDHDAYVQTRGWDEQLCFCLDRFHEIGMVFPNGGAYPINRGEYTEVMWGVGFAWVINRLCLSDTGPFDQTLGHQEEADYALRVRMAGWKCAALPSVSVQHDATATNDPAALERISRGVVRWVNKWTAYFGGKKINYHSTNVIRWEDWPPNALYLEEYWGAQPALKSLNDNPQVVILDGREYDLIRVPRLKGFYRARII